MTEIPEANDIQNPDQEKHSAPAGNSARDGAPQPNAGQTPASKDIPEFLKPQTEQADVKDSDEASGASLEEPASQELEDTAPFKIDKPVRPTADLDEENNADATLPPTQSSLNQPERAALPRQVNQSDSGATRVSPSAFVGRHSPPSVTDSTR